MAEQPKCNWVGRSGQEYIYFIYQLPCVFNASQQGNYIYARKNEQNLWVPMYIGEGDLAVRSSDSHHRADCIRRKGATHFHCHLNSTEAARRAEEIDLLQRYTNALVANGGCNQSPTG